MAALSEDSPVEWEAAQWVARQMGGDAFDEAGFAAWLAGDPRRQPVFDAMWHRIMGPKMDLALGACSQRRRTGRAVCASGVAAVLILLGSYQALPSIELFLVQPRDYAAQDGVIRTVALEDGTRLTLAGDAEVRIRYTTHDRAVELTQGTMFADVAHDAVRPFQITTGTARIVDLGTRFEVAKKPSTLRVTVEAGAVRFGTSGWFSKHIDLTANQAATLTDAGLSRSDRNSAGGVARWRNQWIEYADTPLRQVVADLESVSPLPIRIADSNVANLRVSGRIRLIDPVRQLDDLSVIHAFAADRRDGEIVLSSRKQDRSASR